MSLASLLLASALGLGGRTEAADVRSKDFTPAELFRVTNVWTVHFRFTPEQWAAMEPEGGPGGFFGGPGGGPRGPRDFGPSLFVAPAFLSAGDQDGDGQLSKGEFAALGEKWFAAWDKAKRGSLSEEQLRTGLNETLAPPAVGPPGGRGPGGRGPGSFLQGAEGKRNGLASAMGIEFDYVRADLEFEGVVFKDVAVRYKGNGTFVQSRGSLKRSLKVDLNKFVKGQKLAGLSKLNFHNCVTDASWMNEVLSHRLFREAGVPAPRTAYARVWVTVPGKFDRHYLGLYSLVENIDNNFAAEHLGSRQGAIFKPVTPEPFTDLGDAWENYQQTYDPKTELTPAQQRRLIEFCKLVSHAPEAEFVARLGDYLDLDEFARFMAVTVWLSTLDSILGPSQNYYVYLHPQTGKFEFMPWDLDHSFGQFFLMGSPEHRERLSIHKPWQGQKRFLERVFAVEAFRALYLAHLREFSQSLFQPERFHRQVDEIAAAIRPAVQEESSEKLARFDQVVAGEPVGPAGFGGGFGGPRAGEGPRFGGPGAFFQPPKPIKGFVVARAKSVLAQLAGESAGQTLDDFGFGPFARREGRPGPGRGPDQLGPGVFLGNTFMAAFDGDRDRQLSRDEFAGGFARWFETWDADHDGVLTEEQLRAGIDRAFGPPRGGPFNGPGLGPPGAGP